MLWKSGDFSWEKFAHIGHLEAMDAYLEAQGVNDATQLPWMDPKEDWGSNNEEQGKEEDSPSLEMNCIDMHELEAHIYAWRDKKMVYKAKEKSVLSLSHYLLSLTHNTFYSSNLPPLLSMYTLNPRHNISLTCGQHNKCITYCDALNNHHLGLNRHPGVKPWTYQLYRTMTLARSGTDVPSPMTTSTHHHTRFTATEDSNMIDLATQALQALMETQDELRTILRSVGNTVSPRRPLIEANYLPIPDRFTGQLTTLLASRIGAPTAPKQLTWHNNINGQQDGQATS
ncbi:hypothetical protein FRC09_016600 [Ceratobasidium sp. 395]|nr:hypothetical protein FRC09_016600 [Ceratobasidium sp. 395]